MEYKQYISILVIKSDTQVVHLIKSKTFILMKFSK
jgi:hypothetical protein